MPGSRFKINQSIDAQIVMRFTLPFKGVSRACAVDRHRGQTMKIDDIFGRGSNTDASQATYAETALAKECEKVRTAQNGTRNPTLNVAAFNSGQLVAANMVGRREVEDRLLSAAMECGLDPTEARATIASGLDGGAKKPRSNRTQQTHSGRTGKATDRNNKASALKIWGEAVPAAGTPVETYLKSRGISGEPPHSLRFDPQVRMAGYPSPVPAMIALVMNPVTGEPFAIQRTALAPDGSGKADIPNPKQALGSLGGGAVVFGDVTTAGLIVEGEGIETTLSAAEAFGVPGIATLGSSGLGKPDLPAGVKVVILADRGSEAAARQGARRRYDQGRQAWIAKPPEGFKDFNDVLRSENGAAIIVECIKNATPFEPSPDEDCTEASTEAFTDVFDDEIADEVEPDFSIVDEEIAPPPPFPLDVFGPLAEHLTLAAQAKSAPVDYVAMSVLGATAGLICSARRVGPHEEWEQPAVLWMMNIGSPSSGKSPAMSVVKKPLSRIESELAVRHESDMARFKAQEVEATCRYEEWERLAKEAAIRGEEPPAPPAPISKPALPRLTLNDATKEVSAKIVSENPKGMFLLKDELAGWAGNLDKYGDGDRSFYLEAYEGGRYTVDRQKFEKPLIVPRLAISILGGIQPERARALFMRGVDDGLMSRFLVSWPAPVPPSCFSGRLDDGPVWRVLSRLSDVSLRYNPALREAMPVSLGIDEDGVDALNKWRMRHHADSADKSGLMASGYGKMPGQVLRLALILEFLRWASGDDNTPEPTVVSEQSIRDAIRLIETYFKPMLARVLGDAARDVTERNAATLARAILKRRPAIINAREVRRDWRLPGLTKSGEFNAAADLLVELGWLTPIGGRQGGTPGRQRVDFKVHEAVLRRGK